MKSVGFAFIAREEPDWLQRRDIHRGLLGGEGGKKEALRVRGMATFLELRMPIAGWALDRYWAKQTCFSFGSLPFTVQLLKSCPGSWSFVGSSKG